MKSGVIGDNDMTCKCRNCAKKYEENESRAELKGYCSAKCQHEKAKKLGYRKSNKSVSEYDVLKGVNQIGSIETPSDYSILCDFVIGKK